jgi:hypothetical protein
MGEEARIVLDEDRDLEIQPHGLFLHVRPALTKKKTLKNHFFDAEKLSCSKPNLPKLASYK